MSYEPTFRTVKTLLGVQRQMESILDISPINDPQTTLNTKYGVKADTPLTTNGRPKIRYFGVGINGFRNIDDTNLSEPNEVRATNMDLYTPLPIKCVPFEQDLSAVERANYRMRVVTTISGEQYVLYYLKKLNMLDATVSFTQKNSEGVEEPYTIDYANMSPTPPDPSINGVVNDASQDINVSASAQLLVLGEEIQEAIQVIYGGDMRYAKISEIGLYQGEDQSVTANDFSGTPFNYTEAIMTQLAMHRTWNGTDMSTPSSQLDLLYRFSSDALVLL